MAQAAWDEGLGSARPSQPHPPNPGEQTNQEIIEGLYAGIATSANGGGTKHPMGNHLYRDIQWIPRVIWVLWRRGFKKRAGCAQMLMSTPAGVIQARIYLYRGACDLRRSFDRLAMMVVEELKADPLNGDWYVFLSANKRRMKVLYWDNDGYALWYKRLEQGRFVVPAEDNPCLDRISWAHLLEGISAHVIKRQPRYRREMLKINENI